LRSSSGRHLGALVLVTTRRATHYEGVTMRRSRVQSPRQLQVRWLLLAPIVGRWWQFGASRGHAAAVRRPHLPAALEFAPWPPV